MVVLGDSRIIETDPGEQHFYVDKIVSHSKFNSETFYSDIALLRLEKAVKLGCIQPINLPPPRTRSLPLVTGTVEIAGWGTLTENGPLPNNLRMIVLPVINSRWCSYMYGVRAKPGMFCASEEGRDACQGKDELSEATHFW